jgi:hypothetical protein
VGSIPTRSTGLPGAGPAERPTRETGARVSSSAGRAPRSQCGGNGFESRLIHGSLVEWEDVAPAARRLGVQFPGDPRGAETQVRILPEGLRRSYAACLGRPVVGHPPLWAAIWDQRGLQILAAAFDSSAARRARARGRAARLESGRRRRTRRAVRIRRALRRAIFSWCCGAVGSRARRKAWVFDSPALLSMARSTSGEVAALSRQPGGFDPRTGYEMTDSSTRQGRLPFKQRTRVRVPHRSQQHGHVVQVEGHRSTKSVHAGSNPAVVTAPASSGEHAALIRLSETVRFRPLVRAPGRPARRRLDTAKRAGSIPAERTGSEAGQVPTADSKPACTR